MPRPPPVISACCGATRSIHIGAGPLVLVDLAATLVGDRRDPDGRGSSQQVRGACGRAVMEAGARSHEATLRSSRAGADEHRLLNLHR